MPERRLRFMTSVIRKDKDWLESQISDAVDFMLDNEGDKIREILVRNFMEQLYFVGCAMYIDEGTNQRGKLVIEIDLPDREGCGVVFENNGSLEVLKKVEEGQLV